MNHYKRKMLFNNLKNVFKNFNFLTPFKESLNKIKQILMFLKKYL